ncbi:hypothetical protein ABID92_000024 [Frigoribacterium sp. PvP120]|nr:hypothetical protein [Frigoribacterium sp. PvP121]
MTVSGPIDAAPCRHEGAPAPYLVARTGDMLKSLSQHPEILAGYGLTVEEFHSAFPSAIEAVRGQMSASTSQRRDFLRKVLEHVVDTGLASVSVWPTYGQDTIYRLEVDDLGSVAIIQKGCPDGAHSSVSWEEPPWADETYLWWLCSSTSAHPGEHIVKGINRVRRRLLSDREGQLAGVIFHNELCGSPQRPCPKFGSAVIIDGVPVPPPCVYVMPERKPVEGDWNWNGRRNPKFPAVLARSFQIPKVEVDSFTGYVGFQSKASGDVRTRVTARFGLGLSSTYRS